MGILALVAWKVVVTVYDRREYLAFEKEGKATKWSGVCLFVCLSVCLFVYLFAFMFVYSFACMSVCLFI